MGRKPNQLILEFFDRGAKLPDGSNRYEHTCKACGERFPKGRIESLMSHLKTKCQAIGSEDRHRAFSQSNEHPDSELQDGDGSLGFAAVIKGEQHTTKLPISGRRKLTGLEALAEASRQIDNVIDPVLQDVWKYGMDVDGPQDASNPVGTFSVYSYLAGVLP